MTAATTRVVVEKGKPGSGINLWINGFTFSTLGDYLRVILTSLPEAKA